MRSTSRILGIVAVVLSTAIACTAGGGTADVSVADVQKLQSSDQVVLLDVRSSGEYRAGHIAGASHIPFDRIASAAKAGKLPEDKSQEIIVYCEAGVRAEKAQKALMAEGYKNVRNMRAGMRGWRSAGYPQQK